MGHYRGDDSPLAWERGAKWAMRARARASSSEAQTASGHVQKRMMASLCQVGRRRGRAPAGRNVGLALRASEPYRFGPRAIRRRKKVFGHGYATPPRSPACEAVRARPPRKNNPDNLPRPSHSAARGPSTPRRSYRKAGGLLGAKLIT